MKWKCKKCGTMMHDQENSFFVYDYNRGIAIEYGSLRRSGYKNKKPSGEIWRCPKCSNIQFEEKDWENKKEIFNF